MNILTISTLYPNSRQPRHGIFIETRMRKLKELYPSCFITVIAPVPKYPALCSLFVNSYKNIIIPKEESRYGINVYHPAYIAIPAIGMYTNVWTLYVSIRDQVKDLIKQGAKFDLIDAHYIYPDAVAASWVAQDFNLPIAVTARGSDINILPTYAIPKKRIKNVLENADAVIGVSEALVDKMLSLQPNIKNAVTIRNGIDTSFFYPESNREELRKSLGYDGFCLLTVGNLVEIKCHKKIINILTHLPNTKLFIAGNGPLESRLKEQAKNLSVYDRVFFLGLLTQEQLRKHYTAADCMVLASSNEGWANVLLEAMACGCPVVATPAGGTPEVMAHKHSGVLATDFTENALLTAIMQIKRNPIEANNVSSYAQTLNWNASIDLLKKTFDSILRLNKG